MAAMYWIRTDTVILVWPNLVFFGSDGRYSFEVEAQVFKIPHLRNMYQKVGMFGQEVLPIGTTPTPFFLPEPLNSNAFMGDQIRGFGFLHDGSTDTLFRFHGSAVFAERPASHPLPNLGGFPLDANGILQRRQVEAFMLAFDSNLAPIVGQQITLNRHNAKTASDRINLLIARAEEGECDLVIKGRFGGREAGFLYRGDGTFKRDLKNRRPVSDKKLRWLARTKHRELTYTCVPPGSGYRIGLDRDEDGILDGNDTRDQRRKKSDKQEII